MKDSYNIRINTGLKDFVLIDSINEVDKDKIIGAREFFNAPIFLGIESIAQLGAYHVRFLTSFDRHAFLLKINSFFIPENEALDGNYILYGYLIKRSLTAFLYKLEAKRGYKICFTSDRFSPALYKMDDRKQYICRQRCKRRMANSWMFSCR